MTQFIEELYLSYRADPLSVEPSWRYFFEGVDFAGGPSVDAGDALRRFGHLQVRINPLAPTEPAESGTGLKQVYCSRIGFEYMHLEDPAMIQWFQERIEPQLKIELTLEEKRLIFELLNKSEAFETFIHTKYVGQKRFSLEGGETLIPILGEIIDQGARLGMDDFVIGMAHRGRLNVLANILNKPYSVIFQEFEDNILPRLLEGSGDVKYHKGYTSHTKTRSGLNVHLHLAANSSALESVDAIVLGQTRSKQVLKNDTEQQKVGAILIHGDASIAGQGVVYESLQLMGLPGYSTGGTIHIIVNNQIGFTTQPEESRSTRYCTDIAKTFGCPVFHVNAEDPESCIYVAKLAVEWRLKFKRDVFIDLNCYRKYGHNEGDEPAYTQPLHAKIIGQKKTIQSLYHEQLMREGVVEQKIAQELNAAFKTVLQTAQERGKQEEAHTAEERFGTPFVAVPPEMLFKAFDSSAKEDALRQVAKEITTVPLDFHPLPKLQKLLKDRLAMMDKEIDWGMAEELAFGSLLLQKVPVRLSGQDCLRGTFSQRHAVWVDAENGSRYFPLKKLGQFDAYNSPLSEFACLAFEYGYTWSNPDALVIWEAQFGDFTIGAQTVIDHYITTAEQKWARLSSLVLLLPHGYEGQGPEHSSARIERFLQLAANNNTQVVNATTPAQYFHLLRRQALRKVLKPLIVFTPKSLLRLPACASALKELTSGQFEEVLDDPTVKNGSMLLLCSGKVYYDLLAQREERKRNDIAIARIEQLYPVHQVKLDAILSRYKQVRWVQEEPENMGAWEFIRAYLPKETRYVGRERSAVTATGSFKQHKSELDHFMNEAFE